MTRQGQQAGDNSQQLQAARDINIVGVSAADVVEITRTEVSRVLDELTSSARGKADTRIEALANRVIVAFQDKPELFEAFADPDFQYSLSDAGRAAASNDEQHTEQLLVDLLANRAIEGNAARVRLATSQAIKAADKLSREALSGLTALWAVSSLTPTTESLEALLSNATDIAQALINLGLPTEKGWERDLDVLNLARIPGGFVQHPRYNEVVATWARADLVTGINSEASQQLIESAANSIPELHAHIIPHLLKPGFVRLAGKDQEELLSMLPSTASESEELRQLIGQNGYGIRDNTAMSNLAEAITGTPALVVVADWWNSTPAFDLTVVGDVVGFVNARRYISFEGAATITDLLKLRAT